MITLVTGLWDIGRGELSDGWSRSYEHYLDKFSQLLKVENNMIILYYWKHIKFKIKLKLKI